MSSDVIANIYKNQVPSFSINKNYFRKQGKKTVCLTFHDIRNLIFWLLTSDATKPYWIQFSNIPLIQTVMIVVIDSNQPIVKSYKATRLTMLPLKRTPGPSTWCNHILYNYKASVKRRIDSIDEGNRICVYRFDESIETATLTTDKVEGMKEKLQEYIMDENELLMNNYILYAENEFASFVDTEKIDYNTQAEPILAVDCEMVVTEAGYELARVTCVSGKETVLLDSFAKPEHPVIDYVTKYSGITEEMLKDAPSFQEVQEKVLKLINKDTIMIGHSLENDLKALKIIHHKCVDSAVLYSYIYGGKSKLSYLTCKLLHYVIQNSKDGHDSGEDAIASLRLVYYRVQHNKFTGKLAVPQVPTASLLDIVSKNNKRVVYMDDSQQTSFHGRKANMADMINITKGKETICKTVLSLSHAKKVPGLIYIRRRKEQQYFEEKEEQSEAQKEAEDQDRRNVDEITDLLEIFKENYSNSLFILVESTQTTARFGNVYLYMNTKDSKNNSVEESENNEISMDQEETETEKESQSPIDPQVCTNPETVDIDDI